jgi:hypothetical protein
MYQKSHTIVHIEIDDVLQDMDRESGTQPLYCAINPYYGSIVPYMVALSGTAWRLCAGFPIYHPYVQIIDIDRHFILNLSM